MNLQRFPVFTPHLTIGETLLYRCVAEFSFLHQFWKFKLGYNALTASALPTELHLHCSEHFSFFYLCVRMSVCLSLCVCAWVYGHLEETRKGFLMPWARITGSCEFPDIDAGSCKSRGVVYLIQMLVIETQYLRIHETSRRICFNLEEMDLYWWAIFLPIQFQSLVWLFGRQRANSPVPSEIWNSRSEHSIECRRWFD